MQVNNAKVRSIKHSGVEDENGIQRFCFAIFPTGFNTMCKIKEKQKKDFWRMKQAGARMRIKIELKEFRKRRQNGAKVIAR